MKKYVKYIIIFIAIVSFNLFVYPLDLDEIWCYGFSHNIYSGLIPYKDFNMIVTPFYAFLISIPFHLFGSNILVFHVFQAFLLTLGFKFLFDLIGRKTWILFLFIFIPITNFFPGYNLFLFFLLIILIWLEEKSNYKYKDYIIGTIIGISILTKQSVGVFFIIPSLFYIKDKKRIIKRMICAFIPCFIFLIYLILTRSLSNFIDLCFLGLFDFTTENGRTFTLGFYLTVILFILTIYFMIKDKKKIIYCYTLCFYSMAIPLFDAKHFGLVFLIFLFNIFYCKDIKINISYELFALCSLLGVSILICFFYYKFDISYPNNISKFEYRLIEKNNISITLDVSSYIKNNKDKEFMFLDINGYYFKLINDIPITYLDMFNKGNFGYNGSEKMLNRVKNSKNTLFFVDSHELLRGNQSDKKVIKYVIKHGKKIDSVSVYDVYILN